MATQHISTQRTSEERALERDKRIAAKMGYTLSELYAYRRGYAAGVKVTEQHVPAREDMGR